jgi:hypothetical protein
MDIPIVVAVIAGALVLTGVVLWFMTGIKGQSPYD